MAPEPTRKLVLQLHVKKNTDVDYRDLAYVLLVFAKNLTAKRPQGVQAVASVDESVQRWWFTDYRPDGKNGGGK
ncbi:hypothetical protein ACWEOG_23125 [Amycolatopsis japonica]